MVAMSLTPRHFLTNEMIILSFPPSPVSLPSGTEIACSAGSSSETSVLGVGASLVSGGGMGDGEAKKENDIVVGGKGRSDNARIYSVGRKRNGTLVVC